MSTVHRLLGAAAAVLSSLAAVPATAGAATATTTSSNWAGYAVTSRDSQPLRFRRVIGTWVVQAGSCSRGNASYSAAWIGLGGFDESSTALEQIGTEFDCTGSGRASYSAWYELVPAPSRTIRMRVRPGDKISATVQVSGTRVTLRLRDRTSGTGFSTTKRMSSPDISSAEWIVEAPSGCNSANTCAQLPLSDFGSVSFVHAVATTTGGHSGTISDASWLATSLDLVGARGATPSSLSSGGSAFSVDYEERVASARAKSQTAVRTLPGDARSR
jgi:hypothetical protein